jgi:hypothetical protein
MIKQGELVVVVDNIKEAAKFYTEKLAFDVVDLELSRESSEPMLSAVCLRKGKAYIRFRLPSLDEQAEFSFIKRCASRCVGFLVPLKKGIDRYFARCAKKGVRITQELANTDTPGMGLSFVMRDPFGNKIVVYEPAEIADRTMIQRASAIGLPQGKTKFSKEELDAPLSMLKRLGVLRRPGKKYIKLITKIKK